MKNNMTLVSSIEGESLESSSKAQLTRLQLTYFGLRALKKSMKKNRISFPELNEFILSLEECLKSEDEENKKDTRKLLASVGGIVSKNENLQKIVASGVDQAVVLKQVIAVKWAMKLYNSYVAPAKGYLSQMICFENAIERIANGENAGSNKAVKPSNLVPIISARLYLVKAG